MLEQLKYLDPPGGSDHAALEFNFIFSIKSTNLNRTVLLYDKGDYDKIKQLFNNRDWTQVLQSMNPEEAFDTLEIYTRQLSYANHQKSLLMPVTSNHCGCTSKPPGRRRKSIMRGYDTSTPRVERITKAIFEHAMNRATSPEEPDFERKLAAETKTNNKGFWNYVNSRRKTRTKIADLRTNSGASLAMTLIKQIFSTSNMQIPLQLRTFPVPLISDRGNYKLNLSKLFT